MVSMVDANSNNLALQIFDYCASVEFGKGKAQMAQNDIKQLIEEWAKELAPKRELEAAVELHDRAGNLIIDALGAEKKAEIGWLFENMAEDIKRIIAEKEKLEGRIINANAILSDLMGQDVDNALEADLSIRLLNFAAHVEAFELAAKIDEHRATQLEYIIAQAAKELLARKVSVTPNTPAYAAVDKAHSLLLKDGFESQIDFDELIDS
jgi:hypothetical protein